ncbi:MAG: CotH kinase family protein [Oscillospiraceae bacterium]|nr:CotH kinase family protein [Oscillospiraceae bacterium]
MAENVKALRKIIFFALVFITFALCIYVFKRESKECMGVQILDNTEKYTVYQYADFSSEITHFGKAAAIDTKTNTIYISQNFDKDTSYMDFEGTLFLDNPKYKMYFASDNAFKDIVAAVKDGHIFRLIITDESEKYMEYNVVFTSLPVISIDGDLSYLRDSEAEEEGDKPVEIFSGDITVWTPFDPELKSYTTKSSILEWHVRGNSAANHYKKPWKVALKDDKGENANLNLFGLGSDDDWIFNAIAYDHTRIREKLFIELWNEMAADTDYNDRMTDGQYVEVVMNGEYHGLYLVQRRIDAKFLNLTEHDILLKGKRTSSLESVYNAYEIIHTNLEEDYVYLVMENIFNRSDMTSFNLNNYIDINMFIQMAYARDNKLFNNVYYILRANIEGYKTSLVLWDTDISFGKGSIDFIDYDRCLNNPVERPDSANMRLLYTDYDQKAYERWCQLRQDVFEEEYIMHKIDVIMDEITCTGALARDYQKWGITEDNPDNLEYLEKFISDKLKWLDNHLAELADGSAA